MIRVVKKMLSLLEAKEKKKIGCMLILMIIGGLFETFGVTLMLPLITAVVDGNEWNASWYARLICNFFGIQNQKQYIIFILCFLIVLFLLKNLYLLLETFIQASFIEKYRLKLQNRLMTSYLYRPYTYFITAESGKIIHIMTSAAGQTSELLRSLLNLFTELILCILLVIALIFISPGISIGTGVVIVMELLVISQIIQPCMRNLGEVRYRELENSEKWLWQFVQGIKSIKAAGKEEFFKKNYSHHVKKEAEAEKNGQTIGSVPRLMIESLTIMAMLSIVLLMVVLGRNLEEILPQLSAFVVAAVRLLPGANRIGTALNQIPYYETSLDHIRCELADMSSCPEKSTEEKGKSLSFQTGILAENLDFSYDASEKKVLHRAGLEIPCGDFVGIIGTSGAGKTTLVDLLLGLLRPQGGAVLADGINIEENPSQWRSLIAYIPQNIFFMDDTIRANIIFGNDDSGIDDEKLWAVLELVQMKDYVEGLPDGLESRIGESGAMLSGGQRQRIGIARALLMNPRIIIMDEATSALDGETEKAVMSTIYGLKHNETVIIITHKESILDRCDRIYQVQDKMIVRKR